MIVGVASYDDPAIPGLPSVRRNAVAMRDILTDPQGVGLPKNHCAYLPDPRDSVTVLDAIEEAASKAEDLLFIYYAGHGLLGRDNTAYLAVTSSTKKRAKQTAIGFADIKHELGTRAATKVFIVDSCFSAQAIAHLMGSSPLTEVVPTFRGNFVAASADRYRTAAAPEGDRYTAFTDVLVDVLKFGVPGRGDVLTLKDVFEEVHTRLVIRGAPEPIFATTHLAGDLGFVRNTAATGPARQPARQPTLELAEEAAHTDTPAVFPSGYSEANRRCNFLAFVAFLTVVTLGMDKEQNTMSPFALVALGLLFAFVQAVRVWLPRTHTLEVNAEGLVLRTLRRNYQFDWIDVAQARLASRPRGDFDLVVGLRPGITRPRPTVLTPGPRNGATQNEFVLVRTRQLLGRPTRLDDALRTFAGTARVGSREIDALRAEEAAALEVERFRTKRVRLGVLGVVLTAIGLTPLLTLATTTSALAAVVAALVALVWVIPGLALLVCVHNPAELLLDKHGLRYTRHGRLLKLSWEEIEKIGLTRFLRQSSGPRHLRLRLTNQHSPQDLMLVDLASLSTSADRLSPVLSRFAASRWENPYRPDREIQTTTDATHFNGRAFGWRTLAAPAGAFLAFLAIAYTAASAKSWFSVDLTHELVGPTSLMATLLGYGCVFGALLAARQRCTLTLTDTGFEMRLGRKRKRVDWDEVRHVQLVTLRSEQKNKRTGKHNTTTAIMLTPSRDSVITQPWRLVWFLQPRHGIFLLCPVDSFLLYLDASNEALDQALHRHAGPDRWLPPAIRKDIQVKAR